jgi:D-lactate dehydrogenase (cytochrome)
LRAGAGGDGDDDVGPTSRSTIVTDVCVPLSRFADIITATADDVREKGVVGPW